MTCVLCVTDGRRAETKDRYYLYHNAISREFQSRHESGAFVGKSIFSLWTLACQTNAISYAVCTKSVTKWFYRQIEFNANQSFSCRDDVLEIAGPVIYDLVDSTDSTGARVNTSRFGFSKTEERSSCCRFNLSPSL